MGSLESIISSFNQSSKLQQDVALALEGLKSFETSSLDEYISVKYNICVLNDIREDTPRREYYDSLNELNTAVLFTGTQHFSEEVLFELGNLNFKSNQYSMAIDFLEKSIASEKDDCSRECLDMRFRKRCLKAFCMEYTAQGMHQKSEVIAFLTGYVPAPVERKIVIDRIEELSLGLNIKEILDRFYVPGTNMLSWVLDQMPNDLHDYCFREIAHILAHCFSEYWKVNENLKSARPEHMYMLRAAELLMKDLGDEYVTCYATLKIEQKQYYAAISSLEETRAVFEQERQSIISKENINALEAKSETSIRKQIAQIDFYLWYFGVLNRDGHYRIHKHAFLQYAKEENDVISIAYYHILDLKHLLIEAFNNLRVGIPNDNIEKIQCAYEEFKNVLLRHTLPDAIVSEWDNLNVAYELFIALAQLSKDDELGHLVLFQQLAQKLNTPLQRKSSVPQNRKYSSKYQHWLINLSHGAFLFRGEHVKLISVLSDLGIVYSGCNEKTIESLDRLTKDVANILIVPSEESESNDLEFLKECICHDRELDELDRHIIWVDESGLSSAAIVHFRETVSEISYETQTEFGYIPSIYFFSNMFEAACKCAYASFVEDTLHKLRRPLDSYVISPVTDDCAYESQSYVSKSLVKIHLSKNSTVLQWGRQELGASFAPTDHFARRGKKLDISALRKMNIDIDRLKHVFLFEQTINPNEKVQNHVYAFNLNETERQKTNSLYSDAVTVYDRNGDLFIEVNKLYNLLKVAQEKGRSGHRGCKISDCNTVFETIDLTGISSESQRSYTSIRKYIYSHLGVSLEDRLFLFIQKHKKKNQIVRFAVFSYESDSSIANEDKYQRMLCKLLRSKEGSQVFIDISEEDSYSNASDDVTITAMMLLSKIDKCDANQPFLFVSYRNREFDSDHCIPVYKDVLSIQERQKKMGLFVDRKQFGTGFRNAMKQYIVSDKCRGALIYFSKEYFKSEFCLQELIDISKKKNQNSDFGIIPILIDEEYRSDPVSFVQSSLSYLRKKGNSDEVNALKTVLNIDDLDKPGVTLLSWNDNQGHLSSNSFRNEFNHICEEDCI